MNEICECIVINAIQYMNCKKRNMIKEMKLMQYNECNGINAINTMQVMQGDECNTINAT